MVLVDGWSERGSAGGVVEDSVIYLKDIISEGYLESVILRFWGNVNKTETCWLWTACVNHSGYGRINLKHDVWLAHRLAWLMKHGSLDDSKHVLHHCDTPACVNWNHLYQGTDAENVRDMWARGRANPRANSKLTPELAKKIRQEHIPNHPSFSMGAIAKRYGIGIVTVFDVIHFKTWKEA